VAVVEGISQHACRRSQNEVREKDQPAALAWRAQWWLVVLVDGGGQQMPAARREFAGEVAALGQQVHAEVQRGHCPAPRRVGHRTLLAHTGPGHRVI
jgi:hypothetical protein